MASFGNASGVVPPFAPVSLGPKGSLYVTRQTLATHIATREAMQAMADELFAVVAAGQVKIHIEPALRPRRRRPGASRPRGAQDDRLEHPDDLRRAHARRCTAPRARARRRPKRRSRSPACPIARVDAASWQPSPGLDELKRVNPIAQIPTLVLDDGSILTESAAILIHLGLAHPESGLLASDPARRAQQIRGLVYIGANCYAGIGILDYPERWYPDPDDAVRKAMQARGTGPAARAVGDLRRPVPGDAVALGRAARRARHPRGDGVEVERRAQGARRVAARSSLRCSPASRPIRASRRCGRRHWPQP